MAPKTYPQQIADLKAEKEELLDRITTLNDQLESLPELHAQILELTGKISAQSQQDTQGYATLQAQLNDARQTAASEASHARRVVDENTRLAHVNGLLRNQCEKLQHALDDTSTLDAAFQTVKEQLAEVTARAAQREVQLRDAIIQKETELDLQSRELQQHRLHRRNVDRILGEVRAALQSAPDVLGSLKYIVGINGPSTE